MEDRRLDFNTPLMSVRRFSNSGSSMSESCVMSRRQTFLACKNDSSTDQVTEPVAVPFIWERIPGIAKDRNRPDRQPLYQAVQQGSEDQAPIELVRSCEGSTKECLDETKGAGLDNDNDENNVFSDAVESLSSPESASFSFNYSVSGISGSDGLERKPSGTFSVDTQTRDLMMSRFLPAARAMALEAPQYASRKQLQLALVPYQQPKEDKKEPVRYTRVLPKENKSNIVQTYHELDTGEESESEEEDVIEVVEDYGIVRGKGCGLIPKLCLLNPIPGMKVRTQSPLSQARRSFKDGHSQPEDKPVVKNGDYSYRSDSGTSTPKSMGSKKFTGGGSNRFNLSGELPTIRGSLSPFRRSRADTLLPQQNVKNGRRSNAEAVTPKLHAARPRPFPGRYRPLNYSGELRPRTDLLSPCENSRASVLTSLRQNAEALTPKLRGPGGKPFVSGSQHLNLSGELRTVGGSISPLRHSRIDASSIQLNERSRSTLARVMVPVEARTDHLQQTSYGVEKTLYVDRVHVARKSYSSSNSADQEVWMEPEAKRTEAQLKSSGRKEASLEKSGYKDLKSSGYSDSSTSTDLILYIDQNSKGDEKLDHNSDSLPPLLKSPSESWLYRTLPSVPPRGPSTPKRQSPKLSSHETKWETIVKSSNLRHDHVRYSEELIPYVIQKSK